MVYEAMAEEFIEIGREIMRSDNSRKVLEFIQGEAPVLDFLCKNTDKKIYPKDLSENLSMTPPRIARLLKNMDRKNLITRTVDQTDTRRSIIEITEEGRENFNRRRDEVMGIVTGVLERSGVDDSQELLELFYKIFKIS